jgi:hypothetical protein
MSMTAEKTVRELALENPAGVLGLSAPTGALWRATRLIDIPTRSTGPISCEQLARLS